MDGGASVAGESENQFLRGHAGLEDASTIVRCAVKGRVLAGVIVGHEVSPIDRVPGGAREMCEGSKTGDLGAESCKVAGGTSVVYLHEVM